MNLAAANEWIPRNTTKPEFAAIGKIVMHLRRRHMRGDSFPLTLDEIIEETNLQALGTTARMWLESNALCNNMRIKVCNNGNKFTYKPLYQLKNSKSFINLLKRYDLKNWGGILLEDVQDSLPNAEKIIKKCGNEITIIERPIDKRKVLFYDDKNSHFEIDEPIKTMWHSIIVTNKSEDAIEKYLSERDISMMSGTRAMPKLKPKKRKPPVPLNPKHNKHVVDILKRYDV